MSNTDILRIIFPERNIFRNSLLFLLLFSWKWTLADFGKTKTLFRSGCNYARQSLLPAVWEEVRQGEKSNGFPCMATNALSATFLHR